MRSNGFVASEVAELKERKLLGTTKYNENKNHEVRQIPLFCFATGYRLPVLSDMTILEAESTTKPLLIKVILLTTDVSTCSLLNNGRKLFP